MNTTAAAALPDIVQAWAQGWSANRQVAAPVAHANGWRIDVRLPQHLRRFLFPGLSPALAELGQRVETPWVFLKACATAEELRELLPRHWQLQADGFLMTCGAAPFPARPVPAGYTLAVTGDHRVVSVQVRAPDGSPAAAGFAALGDAWVAYDRIVTEPAHQRRGLGAAVMAALQARAHAQGRHAGVLVATPEGRQLYESLGWRLRSPWATAVIPGPDDAAQSPPTK